MWFNGTSLSAKARRALENEKITIVAHITGHIHTVYQQAPINPSAYDRFSGKLRKFLTSELNKHVFVNFLRFKGYKSLFQFRDNSGAGKRYISLEKLFEYEHSSRYNVGLDSRMQLLNEIDGDEFSMSPLPGSILLNDLEEILGQCTGKTTQCIINEIKMRIPEAVTLIPQTMFSELESFLKTEPRLPSPEKEFVPGAGPDILTTDDRDTIHNKIYGSAASAEMSLLAIYVYRDMDTADWLPFVKAAIERNPVAFEYLDGKSPDEAYEIIEKFENVSIYPEKRLAQPDEVWNFGRGDGVEKAFLLASWIRKDNPGSKMEIVIDGNKVLLHSVKGSFLFTSGKGFARSVTIP